MALGNRVKQLRIAKQLTQKQLAKDIGVTPQTIGAMERRDSKNSDHLIELAKALGSTTEYLQHGPRSTKRVKSQIETTSDDPLLEKLLEAWPHLDQGARKSLSDNAVLFRSLANPVPGPKAKPKKRNKTV